MPHQRSLLLKLVFAVFIRKHDAYMTLFYKDKLTRPAALQRVFHEQHALSVFLWQQISPAGSALLHTGHLTVMSQ